MVAERFFFVFFFWGKETTTLTGTTLYPILQGIREAEQEKKNTNADIGAMTDWNQETICIPYIRVYHTTYNCIFEALIQTNALVFVWAQCR